MDEKLLHRLWCKLLFPDNSERLLQILSAFDYDATKLYRANTEELRALGLSFTERAKLSDKRLKKAKAEYQNCINNKIRILWFSDPDFPGCMRGMSNMPVMLFARGNLAVLQKPLICVVGPRKVSKIGQASTDSITKKLISYGFSIVTGSAEGVDSIALANSVRSKMPVVSILACGMNIDYPRGFISRGMHKNIITGGGLILTEYPFGSQPLADHFRIRNGLLSILSQAVIVTEGNTRSGGMITAGFAMQQGRDLFVFPGYASDSNYEGCNRLIYDGATPVTNIDTLAYDLYTQYQDYLPKQKETTV